MADIFLIGPTVSDDVPVPINTIDGTWNFVVITDGKVAPLVVDGQIPSFRTEQAAIDWITA